MRTTLKTVCLVAASAAIMLFFTFSTPIEPNGNEQQLLAKADSFNLRYPQEKIYLHLDRPSYWADENIWFKAYLLNSPKAENNLYVEFLNSAGDVLQKKMYWAENGLAYGDFNIPDTTSSGVYQIRAYTNWMRNFDECCFFRKNLVVWNLSDKKVTENPHPLKKNDVDLQFFPEGGTFVANTTCRMAFKIVDKNGKGVEAEGKVIDSDRNEVASFKSQFKGMGSFFIQPQAGMKYKALVTVAGNIKMESDLPVPQTAGVALAIPTTSKNKLIIQVSEPETLSSKEFFLVGQSNGTVLFSKIINLENGFATLLMDKKLLPTGVLQVTLFDEAMIPRCERLVFINHHDFINVDIQPDKNTYTTREKVQVNVKTIADGMPFFSNLSMAVSNPDTYLQLESYPNNILTHFLLTSALKGTIEDPAYYFKDDSLTTSYALDNLLLTQGWRQFEWKEISAGEFPKLDYQQEGSITVKGLVRNFFTDKPMPNAQVTLLFVKKPVQLEKLMTMDFLKFDAYTQTANSEGKFNFSNFFFNDTTYIKVQALTPNKKNNTWIDIDNSSNISPDANYLPSNYQYARGKTYKTTSYLKEENIERINRKWKLSDTIWLDDVSIRAARKEKEDGHPRLYDKADFVFDVTKHDDVVGNISEFVVDGRIPGVYGRELGEILIRGNTEPPLLLLDGIPVDVDLLETIPVSSFEKIEVLKFAMIYGSKGNNGAILFFSKPGGAVKAEQRDAKGTRSSMVIGYSVIRQFYSPVYNSKKADVKDFRSTLYWNPIVRTDSTGNAQVSFYNSDQLGEVEVVVEGISAGGKLCRGTCRYNVK